MVLDKEMLEALTALVVEFFIQLSTQVRNSIVAEVSDPTFQIKPSDHFNLCEPTDWYNCLNQFTLFRSTSD